MAFDKGSFRKNPAYEGQGTFAQIDKDLALIRGLDQNSERMGSILGWLTLAVFLLGGAWTAFLLTSYHRASYVSLGVAPVCVIGLLILRARFKRLDLENRRYEFADGLVRLLALEPSAPLRVGLVLSQPTLSSKIVRQEGGRTWYADPWLDIEGQLADGIAFRFARTSKLGHYYQSSSGVRGNKRITTTGWSECWTFEDTLTLRFAPGRFPKLEAQGEAANKQLELPAAFVVKDFENVSGSLSFTVEGTLKPDANPTGANQDGDDAIPSAARLFLVAYELLQSPPMVDLDRVAKLPSAGRNSSVGWS